MKKDRAWLPRIWGVLILLWLTGAWLSVVYTTCKAQDKTVNYTSPTYDIEIFSPRFENILRGGTDAGVQISSGKP